MAKISKKPGGTPYRSVGTTYDGVRILAPKGKPTHFTTREIRRTIEKVLRDTRTGRFTGVSVEPQEKPPSESNER